MRTNVNSQPVRHLYVHVPFCPTICPFCSFHVLERRGSVVDAYLARLDEELAELSDRYDVRPDTVYLGGGTPSHLRPAELERLCRIVERRVGWAAIEATLEVHPSTASARRVADWSSLGFTRLSVGAQSFDDAVLRTLGRPHNGDAGRRTVEWCLATGAVTSVDVMTAIDGQDLRADLSEAVALGVDHVSAYTLTIEAGTPFETVGMEVPDERAALALRTACDVLGAAGFERYEVANYARPGKRCVHNQAYWTGAWFAGVGPSASSMLPDPHDRRGGRGGSGGSGGTVRSRNAETPGWLDAELPDRELVDDDELLGDALLCGLRMVEGIDLDRLAVRIGLDARVVRREAISQLLSDGLVELDGPRLRATAAGMMVLDRVAAELL